MKTAIYVLAVLVMVAAVCADPAMPVLRRDGNAFPGSYLVDGTGAIIDAKQIQLLVHGIVVETIPRRGPAPGPHPMPHPQDPRFPGLAKHWSPAGAPGHHHHCHCPHDGPKDHFGPMNHTGPVDKNGPKQPKPFPPGGAPPVGSMFKPELGGPGKMPGTGRKLRH